MKLFTLPFPRSALTIRQRIVVGYLMMLGVISCGTAIGWTIGNHYQLQALRNQVVTAKERRFLEDLHIAILSVQPGRQLLPYLDQPRRFRQETHVLLGKLQSVQTLLERHHKIHQHSLHAHTDHSDTALYIRTVHALLEEYEVTVSQLEERAYDTLSRVKAILREPGRVSQARADLNTLIQSEELRAYTTFSDQIFELKRRARQREEVTGKELGFSRTLRINIVALSVFVSLIIALLLAIFLSQIITQPIDEVVTVSKRINNENDFDIRIPVHRKDEVGDLSQTLNILLTKVQELLGEVNEKNTRLETTLKTLRDQKFLFVNEKMSSLSQLVAGIAHEVNNPMTFIHTNIPYLQNYFNDLVEVIDAYKQRYPDDDEIKALMDRVELEFLQEDMPRIFRSLMTGTRRISQIVLSLRSFARMDEAESKIVDIHLGLDSTLVMLQHRLRNEWNPQGIQVLKCYGELPETECYAGQMNQVFLNILVNALDALEGHFKNSPATSIPSSSQEQEEPGQSILPGQYGTILLETAFLPDVDQVEIVIGNNGPSVSKELQQRVFDPFFTTKAIGKGTGMGMSICHQIVAKNHGGTLDCVSPADEWGVKFVIRIPVNQGIEKRSLFMVSSTTGKDESSESSGDREDDKVGMGVSQGED